MAAAKGAAAYPLAWPQGWGRTEVPQPSRFEKTWSAALQELKAEIGRMGGSQIVISTNCPVGVRGEMRMDREPVDPGVAVYFQRDGRTVVFASDRYWSVRENIRAVSATIEALRTVERHGTKEMADRSFLGFKALEATTAGPSWWDVLQVDALADEAAIQGAYRRLAKVAHTDSATGSDQAMVALNIARDQALAAARGRG